MASLTLQQYTINALNPDGSVNTLMPTITGTNPSVDMVDFACMGQRIRLELEVELSGDWSDTTTAELAGLFVRYTPAQFVDAFTAYTVGILPNGGYTFVIPSNSPNSYVMPLVLAQTEYTLSNENGGVTIEVIDSTNFIIRHDFRMTYDIEGYVLGRLFQNRLRLSQPSGYSLQEWDNSRPSVYSTLKAYNAVLAVRRNTENAFMNEFSIRWQSAFNGLDRNLNVKYPLTMKFNKVSDNTEVTTLSAFEDIKVTFEYEDPSYEIVVDECEVILTERVLQANVETFEKDLNPSHAKLVTTVSTSTIEDKIKGPVSYTQTGGKTSVSFVVDHTKIVYGQPYDVHAICLYPENPSDNVALHHGQRVSSSSDHPGFDFGIDANWWTYNAKSANEITAAVMERLVNVFECSYNLYIDNGTEPFTTFNQDFDSIKFELKNAVSGAVLYTGGVGKNTSTNEPLSNAQVQTIKDELNGLYRFVAQEFRVPFLNDQNLPNFGVNQEGLNQYILTWTLRMISAQDETVVNDYVFDCPLSVRPYENDVNDPSYTKKVSNIRFLDPETSLPIGAWCDLDTVRVIANVEDLGTDTFVLAFVDRNPYGALYQNDFNLQEEDPQTHTLPSYVTFTPKDSILISDFESNPSDGVVSFLLDISTLSDEDKMRISVMAYQYSE